jgi:protein involved in polysaccharide export with SLBB domain
MLRTVLLLLGLLAPLFPTAADDIPRPSAKPQVTIFGEVGKPGTYRLRAGATLLDALAKAGNLTSRATRTQLQLFRPDQPQPTAIDYQRLVKEDRAQNPPLQDGDVVYVPAEGGVIHLSPSLPEERGMLITVLGAVGTPGVLRMPRGATLLDLIAAAGNFRETAARTEFQDCPAR